MFKINMYIFIYIYIYIYICLLMLSQYRDSVCRLVTQGLWVRVLESCTVPSKDTVGEKETINHFIKSTFLERIRSPVTDISCAKNRVCFVVNFNLTYCNVWPRCIVAFHFILASGQVTCGLEA